MTPKKIEELLKEKKIFQIINDRVVQAEPSISIEEAIQLMQQHRSGYVLLISDQKLAGIFTETDVATKILGKDIDLKQSVDQVMTSNPFTLTPKDTVGEAIDLMAKKTIYHLPLTDESKKLIGMLSVRTLIRFLAEFYPNEVYNLPPDPSQVSSTPEGG